jgi:RNA polymerase sigma-70 factor (ECF subfamily)
VTDSEPSDAELLARHVGGDPHAFGVLVQRHRDRLWAVAIRTLGDRDEAADALQDAFVSAFRRADSFRGDAQFTTWMHRIVVNACLDRIRRRKTRPTEPLPEDEDRMEELGEQPDPDPATTVEERSAVLQALRTLPEPQRSAIVLVDMEGYPVEEAARILGCAVGTIKSRCARGRAKLLPLLRHLRGAGPAAQQAGGPATPPAATVVEEQPRGGRDG